MSDRYPSACTPADPVVRQGEVALPFGISWRRGIRRRSGNEIARPRALGEAEDGHVHLFFPVREAARAERQPLSLAEEMGREVVVAQAPEPGERDPSL